jgi:hypothetical protein
MDCLRKHYSTRGLEPFLLPSDHLLFKEKRQLCMDDVLVEQERLRWERKCRAAAASAAGPAAAAAVEDALAAFVLPRTADSAGEAIARAHQDAQQALAIHEGTGEGADEDDDEDDDNEDEDDEDEDDNVDEGDSSDWGDLMVPPQECARLFRGMPLPDLHRRTLASALLLASGGGGTNFLSLRDVNLSLLGQIKGNVINRPASAVPPPPSPERIRAGAALHDTANRKARAAAVRGTLEYAESISAKIDQALSEVDTELEEWDAFLHERRSAGSDNYRHVLPSPAAAALPARTRHPADPVLLAAAAGRLRRDSLSVLAAGGGGKQQHNGGDCYLVDRPSLVSLQQQRLALQQQTRAMLVTAQLPTLATTRSGQDASQHDTKSTFFVSPI